MKDKMKTKKQARERRKIRVKAQISGTKERPRLSVFRSLKGIYAQLIDDEAGKTLVSISDKGLKGKKVDKAKEVGKLLAEKAKEVKIKAIVFDRSSYKYHGRIKALADGAREGGLEF